MSVSDIPAGLAERLAALTPAQRALFELALQKQAQPPAPAPALARTIPRRERFSPCPLSFDQERLWFVQQLDTNSPIYNVYQATRFRVAMDPLLLARALNEVVRLQESLRTTFTMIDGRPMQVIAPSYEVNLPWIDLRGLPEERREAEAQRAATQVVSKPFDIGRLPLLRIVLIQVDEADYVSPLAIHHIITDWVATYTLLTEMGAVYEAFRAGHPSPLAELPVQYGDFAEWQRVRLSDPALVEARVAWWRERLHDAPELLPLPYDHPRPAVQTARGRRTPLMFSAAHATGLRALAAREGATLFIVLLAALKVLLVRVTGEEKLIVGTPSAHRNLPELERVIGFFLNQLALYTDLTGNPTLTETVRRVRETALGAYAHEDLPFAKVVEALRPGRDISRTPFTQIVLLLLAPHDALEGRVADASGDAENFWVDAHRTQFDTTLSIWEGVDNANLAGWWEHNADLFDPPTIDRLKAGLRRVVAACVDAPETRLWDVAMLSPGERQQLLVEWPGEGMALPGPLVHERIAAHAARQPEAEAVVYGERRLSYGELDRLANGLAWRLRRLGVGPEAIVGLCVERSAELVVAILGVLKAGGAYLVLDPAHPDARLAFQVGDALGRAENGAAVLLAGPGLGQRAAALAPAGVQVEALEITPEDGSEESAPPPLAGPDHPAYLIYTSGTTGTPKAVVLEHGNLAALLGEAEREFGLLAGDQAACLAAFTFDLSVLELFSTLATGGTLHLFPLVPTLDFPALLSALGELTVFHSVPALMQQVVDAARLAGPYPGVRVVTCGGDRVPPSLAAEMRNLFPRARIVVMYGPTEGTVFVTLGRLDRAGGEGTTGLGTPLGRPLASAVVQLMDRQGGPVAIGVAGEIWIAGPQVARGYLGRPELTAEKFVERDGRRFYCTGDLARWLPDGRIEFLGRVDHQVKVRGYRIEPGEVEAVLAAQPGVRHAAVVATELPDGRGHRLVAYLAPEEGTELRAEPLQAALRERLPEYMVPTVWMVLPELPLSSSGKIDRKSLPAPTTIGREGAPELPRTPMEDLLAGIWAEVLGRPSVGIQDNFFALGGDSILSIQVVTRAQAAGVALTPRMMFLHQTVAELAAVAGSAGRIEAEQGAVTGPVRLTPIQEWYFAQESPEPWHDNQALLLASARPLDPARLEAALAHVEAHHDALRLRFGRVGGGWEAWQDAPAAGSPLTVADLSALPPAALSGAVTAGAAAAQRSLDLARGPIHRPVLFQLGGEDRFLWAVHHLAVDGVSWRMLLEDLAVVYSQLEQGAEPRLPRKTTSFQRWSERLAELAGSDVLRREAAWWRALPWEELAPVSADGAIDGPADGPADGPGTVAEERISSFTLSAEETRALLEEVPRVYNSQINDALLSALARAFHAWSGRPVLAVDLEGHGREELFPDVDLSRTVGWFTSVFPVLLDLRGGEDPGAALKSVKETLRTIPNGGLGWGLLRRSPESLAGLPAPRMSFNYLGQVDQGLPSGLPFAVAPEPAGANRSPRAPRAHLLEWNGNVAGGRLQFLCTWPEGRFRPETVERLTAAYATALRELIEHCRQPGAGGYTPSDFPLAGLDQGKLDKLLARRKKPQ